MIRYIIIHNKHEGCYDFQCYEDQATKMRLTSITINPPKIFMFNYKEQAQDFFEDYINDIDNIDPRCRKGEDVEHVDYCTCGIIEMDEEENPILFYNKRNQIFLLEHGPEVFTPPKDLTSDIKNLNATNKLIRKCKTLTKEQRSRYVELGRVCKECTLWELEETPKEKNENEHEIKHKKIHTQNKVGVINGLWANSLGKGGIIPIQTPVNLNSFSYWHIYGYDYTLVAKLVFFSNANAFIQLQH